MHTINDKKEYLNWTVAKMPLMLWHRSAKASSKLSFKSSSRVEILLQSLIGTPQKAHFAAYVTKTSGKPVIR